MGNRWLLYTLYNIAYDIAHIVHVLLRIIFYIPYRIPKILMNVRMPEAYALIKNEAYYYFNQLKIHGLTFSIRAGEGKPQVIVRSYDEQLAALADSINRGNYESTKMFIKNVLTTMKQCRFAIINDRETDMRFIQFRIDSGTVEFDFPMCPGNINGIYSTQILTLLRKIGFKKHNGRYDCSFLYKTYTIYTQDDTMTRISADFGKNMDLVVNFSTNIFNKIFKSPWIPTVTFG